MRGPMARAHAGWGDHLPDWIAAKEATGARCTAGQLPGAWPDNDGHMPGAARPLEKPHAVKHAPGHDAPRLQCLPAEH